MKMKMNIALLTLMLSFAPTIEAKAVSVTEIAGYVLDKVKSTAKGSFKTAQKLMCQKASFPFKYSLRSASGLACKNRHIALVAKAACTGYEDFDQSGCNEKATEALGGNESIPAMVAYIVKKDTVVTSKFVCALGQLIPAMGQYVNAACDAAEGVLDLVGEE